MKVTIKDVAKKANVSIATVSRVLNNKPGFSSDTKKKVLQVINELGYHPNTLARSLVGKKSNTIGVLMPNLTSMFTSEILSGIEDSAHYQGYSVIICNTDNKGRRTEDYLDVLKSKQIDGVIVVSETLNLSKIKALEVPVVLSSTKDLNEEFTYIIIDNEKAAYQATNYLIKKGHSKVAMISGPENNLVAGKPRFDGYMRAMADAHLIVEKTNIIYGDDFSFESGKECMENLIKQGIDFTAVFAASDEIAVGVLSVAHKYNLKVPGDISVIGFDNTRLAQMTTPLLTVLSQPIYQLGYQSVEMLINKMDKIVVKSKLLPFKIVERQSVKEI